MFADISCARCWLLRLQELYVRFLVLQTAIMNRLLPICFLSMLAVACSATSTYSTSYDNLDLDEILNNSRLYTRYFQCLTNKARCTPDGKELKGVLPDALATGCAKCTEKQRLGSEKVIRFLLKNKPSDFEELEKMYDPNGTYRHMYEQEAKKLGIKV